MQIHERIVLPTSQIDIVSHEDDHHA